MENNHPSHNPLRIIPLDPTGIRVIGREEVRRDLPMPPVVQLDGRKSPVPYHPVSGGYADPGQFTKFSKSQISAGHVYDPPFLFLSFFLLITMVSYHSTMSIPS